MHSPHFKEMRLSVVLAAWLLGLCGASKGRAWFSLLAGRAEEKTAAEEPGRAFLSLAEHDAQVAVLCSAIGAAPPGTQLSIRRKPAESHCARPHNYKRNTLSLDMSRFTSVLGVAPLHIPTDLPLHLRGTLAGTQVCIVVDVQAMCSFEALVDVLLPLGLIPAVVPEFKGITVGGSLQGLAAESTSFKFGYVHDCIVGFEAVLGDGRVVWCTDSNQHADLFRALPGSFGSLAICTRIRMLCLPAAPLVQCRIQHWASADECLERLSAIQAGGRAKATGKYAANGSDKGASTSGEGAASGKSWPDFAEGIGYSEGSFATIEGRFVTADADAASSVGAAAEAAAPLSSSSTSSSFLPSWLRAGTVRLNGRPHTLARCGRWGHDWFYSQVRAALPPVRVGEASLLLPTKDYLFRHGEQGYAWGCLSSISILPSSLYISFLLPLSFHLLCISTTLSLLPPSPPPRAPQTTAPSGWPRTASPSPWGATWGLCWTTRPCSGWPTCCPGPSPRAKSCCRTSCCPFAPWVPSSRPCRAW